MAISTPPGFLQNAGATHTAVQLRQHFGALQAGNFSSTTSLRSRGGIHPTLGQEFFVQQAGSPNMTVLVESGVCSIPGTESGAQGNYSVFNDAQVTLSIAAAHATLPRIDIVVVNVRDQVYSGASNDAQLQVITGTAASSPAVPTAPANSITVAQIAVGAAVSSITNANITDTRFYLAAAGGVINARNDAARPAGSEIAEGQLVWAMDNNRLSVWDGAAYQQLFPSGWTKINESVLGAPAASITFSSIPSTYRNIQIMGIARGDNAAAFISGGMRFNSDTTAVYDGIQLSGVGSTPAAFESLNQTFAAIGEASAATAVAGSVSCYTIFIPFYAGTTFWKTFTVSHMLQAQTSGGAAGAIHTKHWTGRWRNTGAVTSITIFPTTGNFIAGTSFAIYGLL